jgi:zinc transporter ZupT
VGVQNTLPDFLGTAVAIGFHKWADALSMGCHYRNKNVSKKMSYTLIIIQGVLNIAAIGLGWVIASSGEIAEAIFLSLSAGTFLAISTLEILGEQFHHSKYMKTKFALLVGSTGFVASIWFVENQIFGA